MPAVRRDPCVTLHHQITTLIRDGIAAGRYRPGDQLPTEDQLCNAHGVSRVTVRRALQSLEEQGFIERRRRHGTFVADKAAVLTMTTPMGPYLKQVAERRTLSRPVVQAFDRVRPPPDVQAALQTPADEPVLRVVRLRLAKTLPLMHSTVYVPQDVARGLKRSDFNRRPLSELLMQAGHAYGRIDMVTRARLATPEVARLLHVPVASALVDVQRIGFDLTGRPIEWQQILGPPDRFATQVTMRADDVDHTW